MDANENNASVLLGISKGEGKLVNIFPITPQASVMSGIRNIIQAKFTNMKVIRIRPIRTIPFDSERCMPKAFSMI